MNQKELVQIFDNLKIKDSSDFRKLDFGLKKRIISRLFNYFSYSNLTKELLNVIDNERGVKFHFDCPNKNYDYKKLNTFSKKISFYSDRTLISVPIIGTKYDAKSLQNPNFNIDNSVEQIFGDIETERKKKSFAQKIKSNKGYFYLVRKKEIDHLINVITSCRDSIKSNDLLIVSDIEEILQKELRKISYTIPANFELDELKTQFFEYNDPIDNYYGDFLPPYQLLLPTFHNIPNGYLLEIRTAEKELYDEFHLELKEILLSSPETDEKLYDYLVQIDINVNKISKKFEELGKQYKRRNIFALMSFTSLPIMLVIPQIQNVATWVIPHLGMTLAQYLISQNEKKSKEKKLNDYKHYVMWKIHKRNNNLP